MAARSGAGRSHTSSSSRPQEMMGGSSYEDVQPESAEWIEERAAHILSVHLPGFTKEQIRVTYDENSHSFNIRGERPLANNRFGRVNVDFTIPDNCKIKAMKGRFQDEVLTITIPKEYISPFFDPRKTTTGAQLPPERRSDYEKSELTKREPNGKSLDQKAAETPSKKVPDRGEETREKEMKRANDTDVAAFAGKEMMRPKLDLVKSKAGESKSAVVDDAKKNRDGKVGDAEKQFIVNLGVAALVLVALGAYVGYNFAYPGSEKY